MSAATPRTLSPMLLAVLANRFDGVVREMSNTLLRAARSAVINSARDFSCGITTAGNEMFATAAHALAHEVSEKDLAQGRVYPALSKVRDVSAIIATAVARLAYDRGLARLPQPDDLVADVRARMFDPKYADYVE